MAKLLEAFQELSIRFIVNCPQEELASFDRLFFQIEAAHWFYEDFLCEKHSLPHYSFRTFVSLMFQYCPMLQPFQSGVNELLENFKSYKSQIPVFGAIMLNEALDKVVLVKGWKKGSSWTFPRGKMNKDEAEEACAVREVWEETGFSVKDLISPTEFIEFTMGETPTKLFLVAPVPEDTEFVPQTRKEISSVAWFALEDLKRSMEYVARVQAKGVGASPSLSPPSIKPNTLFTIFPALQKLTRWIQKRESSPRRVHFDGCRESPAFASPPPYRLHHRSTPPPNPFLTFTFDRTSLLACLPPP